MSLSRTASNRGRFWQQGESVVAYYYGYREFPGSTLLLVNFCSFFIFVQIGSHLPLSTV